MEITKFDRLRRVVESLGASQVVANLEKLLLGEGIDVDDPERIITGESGIFHITPEGTLTRVIVYIVDKAINDRYAAGLSALVNSKQFSSQELIKNLHKFHLLKCKTIERAENEGWKSKYKMSRRQDGTFFYRFIDKEKVISRDKQVLRPCKNCLSEINNIFNLRYTIDNFNPRELLSSEDFSSYGLPKIGEVADFSKPNTYSKDWNEISKKYRALLKYQCQESDCPAPDLSDNRYRKFLHTHHVSQDKSNNAYHNLKALCIYCHAKLPNHSLVRTSPDYIEYIRIRNLS